jgi:peptide/nickel transport system substrate-binding protein
MRRRKAVGLLGGTISYLLLARVVPAHGDVALHPEGEFRIALADLGTETLDPSLQNADGAARTLPLLFDPLVGVTPDKAFSRTNGLATNWKVTHSATNSVYTFYLRNGIRFHDGSKFAAPDVKFTIEHFMRKGSITATGGTWRQVIAKVEIIDPYTVTVTTRKPYGFLLVDMSQLEPQNWMMLPKDYIEARGARYFNEHPIGTGPYRFKAQQVGSHITFEAVDYKHWLYGVPRFKTFTIQLVPEEATRVAMLKRGETDAIVLSRQRVGEVRGAGFEIVRKGGSDLVDMFFGNTWDRQTFLVDARVREALNLAINRDLLLQTVLAGGGVVTGSSYYSTWTPGYQPLPVYPYDPARALRLLKEAFPQGIKLTLHSFVRAVPEVPLVNEAIVSTWKGAFGNLIDVRIVPMDYDTHRKTWSQQGLPNNVATHSSANRPFFNSSWDAIFKSDGILPLIKDAQLDQLIDQADAEPDLYRLKQRMYDVAKYIRQNHYTVPLFALSTILAMNPKKVSKWDLGGLPYLLNYWDLIRRA